MGKSPLSARDQVPVENCWNLAPLYPDDQHWEESFDRVRAALSEYETYRGRMAESAQLLRQALDFHLQTFREMDRVATYAHLKSDQDRGNPHYLGLYQRSMGLWSQAAEASSFIQPEILAIDEETMDALMADESLAELRIYLQKILRNRPHTLTLEMEQLLAMSMEMARGAGQVFGQLNNADLQFGEIEDEDGAPVTLTHANFSTFLQSPNRQVRKSAFFTYYHSYEIHRHTLAATLGASIQRDIFFARARKFNDCRAAALFGDKVPAAVYDRLVETVRENAAVHQAYLSFRRRSLGLEKLHFYDTYVTIVPEVEWQIPYEQGVALCLEALAPLGDAYIELLKEGLGSQRWVDRYENKGKRSGAYSSGCYDSPPYILMNYEEKNLNSVYTLAHEAGHSMHTLFSNRCQPYAYHDYTIFAAEVASTFNELLMTRHLLDKYADDPSKKAAILNREVDNIRGTIIRQTMFAEFESAVHQRAEQRQALTLETFTDIYQELLEAYFGDSLVIDEPLLLECLRIPHFYSAYYVYKYATGLSAAIALVEKVLNEGPKAKEAYLRFLSAGGKYYPLDALKAAGVDLTENAPVKRAMQYFSAQVQALEKACDVL